MNQELSLKNRNRNLKYFILFLLAKLLIMTLIYFLLFSVKIVAEHLVPTILLFVVITIILFAGTVIFARLNARCYDAIINAEEDPDTASDLLQKLPFRGAIIISVTALTYSVINVLFFYIEGVFIAIFQLFFFYTIAHFFSLILGFLFYYFLKGQSFALIETVFAKPLTISAKLIIPLLSVIFGILGIIAVISYKSSYDSTMANYIVDMKADLEEHNEDLTHMVELIHAELRGYSPFIADEIRNPAAILAYLRDIHAERNPLIESIVVIREDGMSYSSIGFVDDLSTQPFFKTVMETKKTDMSSPHFNIRTGIKIITYSIPLKMNDGTWGIIAATIPIVHLATLTERTDMSDTQQFMLIDKQGTLMFHSDKSLEEMTVGRSPLLTSDWINTFDIERLVTAEENKTFEYTLNGKKKVAIKTADTLFGWIYVFAQEQFVILNRLSAQILTLLVMINVLAFLIFLPTFQITSKISKSISGAMEYIDLLTQGRFITDVPNVSSDEMGFLVQNVVKFSVKLKGIISKASETSIMLESSSEELADASRNLSEGAQSRAAAVEEATAAIEEVTSSVEQIGNSVEKQAQLASVTFTAMEQLKGNIGTVLENTENALDMAGKTTKQAQLGNKIMLDTITSMDSIDNSTKKIADMILMVNDISDQVNLLALNASIEAARAGEHGKGFAIVAEEISKLADESATATTNITELVKTGLKEVAKGRKYVSSTKSAFDEIINNIESTDNLINSITQLAKEQFEASETVLNDTKSVMEMSENINIATNEQMVTHQEMSRTIEQINQGTLSEAARSEEIAFSASEINTQAVLLSDEIKFFKL